MRPRAMPGLRSSVLAGAVGGSVVLWVLLMAVLAAGAMGIGNLLAIIFEVLT